MNLHFLAELKEPFFTKCFLRLLEWRGLNSEKLVAGETISKLTGSSKHCYSITHSAKS